MKTITIKKTLTILLLTGGVFFTSTIWACTANFNYTVGLNGHVTFRSTSTGIIFQTQYNWNFGDNTNTVAYNDSSVTHTYQSNGTFSVLLFINSDSTSCYDSIRIPVVITNVTTPCNLSAAYTYTLNANGATSFTSTSTGTNTNTFYYWNAGDGSATVLGTSTFSHTYAVQGYYYPKLIVEDTGSAYCSDSASTYINVNNADSNSCGLHARFTYTLGSNGYVSFLGNSYATHDTSAGYLYSWNVGDGSSITSSYDSTFNHFYLANGTYTVSLQVTSYGSGTCIDTADAVITITNVTIPCNLSAGFNVINDTTTGMVNIISTSTGTISGTQYYWNPGNGSPKALVSSGDFNYTYTANGSYSGTLIVENTGTAFCIDSISKIVNVSNVDSLHASFITNYSLDTIYYYSFTSTSTGINNVTTYAWEPGDTTGGDTGVNMTTYSHAYIYPGVHTVTLSLWFTTYPIMPHKAPTSAGNDMYDFSTYSMQINVGSPAGVATISDAATSSKLYPNPNNGAFKLEVNGVTGTQNATVEVTNILGELIYQTTASVSNGTIMKDINLANITNGTYFVRVITSNTVYNTKTIINR